MSCSKKGNCLGNRCKKYPLVLLGEMRLRPPCGAVDELARGPGGPWDQYIRTLPEGAQGVLRFVSASPYLKLFFR